MLFQLPSFLLFLLVFTAVFACSPAHWRKWLTVLASLFFYAWWNIFYLSIIFFFVIFTWFVCQPNIQKRTPLFLLVCICLAPLLFYKYIDFLLANVTTILSISYEPFGYLLPLGISFITFSALSIIIDTYKTQEGQHSFVDVALFISFFPQLIAGPILRKHQFFPQFNSIRLDWGNAHLYMALFAVGIIKKVLLADNFGLYVDDFYNGNGGGSIQGLTAILAFSAQIYCDFSSYTDMAIALAGFMGVRFPDNFRSPYFAHSITDFWRRWHMTLSSWLRDYVFLPLHKKTYHYSRYLALFCTMIISGLWHGASWNSLIWGGLHGLVMIGEAITGQTRYKSGSGYLLLLRIFYTFSMWSLLAVIFRAPTLQDAYNTYATLFSGDIHYTNYEVSTLALVALVLTVHHVDQVDRIYDFARSMKKEILLIVSAAIIFACSISAMSRPENFYYFNF